MARKPVTDMSAWPSLTLEGNLIAPAMIASIDRRQAPEQTEADYRIRKGLTIREEISTAFRVGQFHYDAFAKLQNPSAEATRRFIRGFLAETFGFDDLAPADGAVAFLAGGRVPVVVVPPTEDKLDRRSPTLSTDRARSPAFALQDYLNENDAALWGLVTNGTLIRLMRDNASLTRPAYIEADVASIFTNEDAASFAVLWSLLHRTRFGAAGAPVTDCPLERWREAGTREGEVARDRLAAQVEVALKALGSGFLEANPDLAARLRSGEVNLTEWFNELLRLVYRLIFLMVAEDRNLLHPDSARPEARKLYAEGYSLAALRVQCVRAASWDKHHDRFEAMKIVFRALTHGQPVLGLPALGGLFAADMLPHLEAARLRNRAFMEALYRLSWLPGKIGIAPVNWRAMETEELGSVYESLLELQPQLGADGKTLHFASEAAEQKGNQRKTTGSYYTPDSLVQALLDTALDPVLDKTEAEAPDPVAGLLKLSVIDPACGSGHFLLAAARRIATRVARIRAEGTPSLADFRHALRDVARGCLHGVDRNPMAVELTKVALWIETVDPGLPLGFFDAQIRCGDSLLGVFDLMVLETGVPDAAYKPLTGDDKEVARHYAQKNKREQAEKSEVAAGFDFNQARDLMRDFEALRAMPESTIEQIDAKSHRLHALTAQGASAWQLETACDLYVSAFLLPKAKGGPNAGPDGLPHRGSETVPTSGTIREWLRGVRPLDVLFDIGVAAARTARAFHWPLEFPNVMQRGGFDVVCGNPPWDVMQLGEEEYFAKRLPDIASMAGAARKKAIAELAQQRPEIFFAYLADKRHFEAANEFARASGRFELTARGKVNSYALFAEQFAELANSRGRAGVIVPTGIATDASTAPFFADLVAKNKLSSIYSFREIRAIFPATDDRNPFCLLTMGSGIPECRFAFFLDSANQIANPERNFVLSSEQIEAINPITRNAPIFRSRADADLAAKIFGLIAAIPRDPDWITLHQNVFSSSNEEDLEQFSSTQPSPEAVSVFRGAFFNQYYHEKILGAHLGEHALQGNWIESDKYVTSNYYQERVKKKALNSNYHLTIRRIARSTDVRTMIATVLPMVATDDTASVLSIIGKKSLIAAVLANLNSLCLDYTCGFKIGGTDIRKHNFSQLPIIPANYYSEARLAFIIPKILELTYTSCDLTHFAHDLGYEGPPFAWDEQRRAHLRAELDAFYAAAYGLTRDELRYVLDPVDIRGADYPSETFRVLKENEISQFGEYRTRRLVLEAWDRMEAEGTFVDLGLGASQIADTAPIIQKPALAMLPDGAWTRAAQQLNDAGAALTAILKAINPSMPSRTIRVAAAMVLEPHLLTSLLPAAQAREWRRLVGQEAEPRSGNVVGFAARTNQGWGIAVSNHRGNGRLIEDLSAGTWAPGPGLNAFDTAGWPDGRAGFVLYALRQLDLDQTVTSMPDEVRGWIAHAAAA